MKTKGPSKKQLRKVAATNVAVADYATPNRFNKQGALKKGYRYSAGTPSPGAGRVPVYTEAIAPKANPRRAVFGGERASKGATIVKKRAKY